MMVNKIILTTIFYLTISLIDIVYSYENKTTKEIVFCIILFILTYILSILIALEVKIPSPAKGIEWIIEGVK